MTVFKYFLPNRSFKHLLFFFLASTFFKTKKFLNESPESSELKSYGIIPHLYTTQNFQRKVHFFFSSR